MAISSSLTNGDEPSAQPVIKLSTKHYLQAAATLADAFVHDDVARYFIDTPDREHWTEAQKWNLHLNIMNYVTYAHCLRGLTTAVGPPSDPHGCVALWMPPHCNIESASVFLSSGMWRLFYKLSFTGSKRFFREFIPLLERTKAEVLGKERANNCYYLVYLGTKPNCRGQGLAKKLIQDVSAKADEEGRCCYLESSSVRNLKLYRRMGFEVRKQIMLGKGTGKEIPLDIMVREPGGLLSMEAVDSGVSMTPQGTKEKAEEDK